MPTNGTEALLPVIAQFAGIVLLLGTMLLIGLRRIYFDAKTKQAIEIELPLFGKVKTQAPAFGLIIVGACLVLYPLAHPFRLPPPSEPDKIRLQGAIDPQGSSVEVDVVAYTAVLNAPSTFHMDVIKDAIKDPAATIKFIVGTKVVGQQEPGPNLRPFVYQPEPVSKIVATQTQKEVSDEELRRRGILR